MNKITVNNDFKCDLIKIAKDKNVFLEGNILKLIDSNDDDQFNDYITQCIERDKGLRRIRLEITKRIQQQNKELIVWKEKNELIQKQLHNSLIEANSDKENAIQDLTLLQKKTQLELIDQIVKVSLAVIIGVGLITTGLYWTTIVKGNENQIIESTWANMFSILLTNSFSIIGTIMGIKWSTETKK